MGRPDPDDIRTDEDLRRALIWLAGTDRKLRSIARDSGLAPSSVSDLFTGKRRVTRHSLVALVGAYAPRDLQRWVDVWSRVSSGPAEPTWPVPRQLPADVPAFVGREHELGVLNSLLDESPSPSASRLITVVGTAGVGKTALAVRWGHQRQNKFPDGSLYVDLRGYDPSEPVEPAEALAGLLRSLGLTDVEQPVDVAERAARYRSLLAERRVLVVLDNARDSEQVRLLLPGASLGATVITARDSLEPVRDRQGARRLELDVLPDDMSARLLHQLLAGPRSIDPAAVDSVVSHCAGLPLALRIAAGLATDRHGGLSAVAAELSDDHGRLDLLDAGDPRTAVRSVLSWSFRTLDGDVGRTFRLLGLSPLLDVDVFLAAALADLKVSQAQQHLRALLRARLLHERSPGRMGMHDLLRDYARDRVRALDAGPEQNAALQRLRSYLLDAADRARYHLDPGAIGLRTSAGAPELPVLDRPELAVAWFEVERPNILATIPTALRQKDYSWICQIADAAWRHLLAGGHFADSVQLHQVAYRAACEWDQARWEARALEHLGIAEQMLSRYDDSLGHLEQAVERSRVAGDQAGEARALGSIGTVYARRGEHQLAIEWLQRGLEVAQSIDAEPLQVRAGNNIGLVYQRWGRPELALKPLNEAVKGAEQMGDTQLLAITLNNRSLVLRRLNRRPEARDDILAAQRLAEDIDDQSLTSEILDSLGSLLLEDDDPSAALSPLNRALDMHREAGHKAAEAETLDNLGTALLRLGRAAEALARHAEAIELAESIGDRGRIGNARIGNGAAHRQLRQWQAAEQELTAALELARQLDNQEQQARALDQLARLRADRARVSSGPAGRRSGPGER